MIASETEPLPFLETDVLSARMFQTEVLPGWQQSSLRWTTDLTCLESSFSSRGGWLEGTDLVSVTVEILRNLLPP